VLGGVDAGGQNVHVAELSALARRGHRVSVYTRGNDPDLADTVETAQGYSVVHVPAGPAQQLPKDELLRFMGPFARYLDARWADDRPDVAHAHFWTSGIATHLVARHLDLPRCRHFTRSAWSNAVTRAPRTPARQSGYDSRRWSPGVRRGSRPPAPRRCSS